MATVNEPFASSGEALPVPTAALEYGAMLAVASQRVLARLATQDWAEDLYLAGSAALTLYLGHRAVRDVDLMGVRRLRSAERRDILQDVLAVDPGARVETARDGYLAIRCSDEFDRMGLRLFYYPYPLVDTEEAIGSLAVASLVDLAAMKLAAATSRAGRRDFVDLYFITRRLDLGSLLDQAAEKFGHVEDFPLQALKGLADLEVARSQPTSQLAVDFEWAAVEDWVARDVRDVARCRVALDPG